MNYEIVTIDKKTIVGVSAITSNQDPKMGEIIGGLWTQLYQNGVNAQIKNKINDFAIGLYSDYQQDGSYTVTAGNEVSHAENTEYSIKTIPAGRYAKFSVSGDMEKAVAEAWGKIWQIELNRTFSGDFEEYLNSDFENARIDIYIAIK